MQTESIPHLPTNHVFVDLENVKVIDLSVIGGKNLILHLFIGPNNKKLIVAKAPTPKRCRLERRSCCRISANR
jgi:hypothetical protein